MASYLCLLEEVSVLTSLNNEINIDVSELESDQARVELQFETNLKALNLLIQRLPNIVTSLLVESPPTTTATQSLVGCIVTNTNSMVARRAPRLSTESLQDTVADLREVGMHIESAARAAKSRQLNAADLSSRAARQVEKCTSTANSVSEAKSENQNQIGVNLQALRQVEIQLAECSQMSSRMAASARSHASDAESHGIFFWATFWIPVVNLVTIPVSLMEKERHENAEQVCRASEATYLTGIQQKQWEKLGLEAKSRELDDAYKQLDTALQACAALEKQASGLKNHAKNLTDQYGVIALGIRQVMLAMDPIHTETDVRDWNSLRFTALYCLREMMASLRSVGCLDDNNYALLERLRVVDIQEDALEIVELEW
ncbi:hypothetical protein V8E51_011785 [Hyaloscypha variabilis]